MRTFSIAIAAILIQLTVSSVAADWAELGLLRCTPLSETGFDLGSRSELECTLSPARREYEQERYYGTIDNWQVGTGTPNRPLMEWIVYATGDQIYRSGNLEGNYSRTTQRIAVTDGPGAPLLIGGPSEQLILHPLSVQPGIRRNLATVVAEIYLW